MNDPKVGYRHIDCAYGYGNESEVGKALEYGLKELKIPRKVYFKNNHKNLYLFISNDYCKMCVLCHISWLPTHQVHKNL